MNDFLTMMQDAMRLKAGVLALAAFYDKKKYPGLWNRIHAALIMLERSETVNQLDYACDLLRTIFKDLDHQELEYEREIPDTPQSSWGTSVRRGGEARDRREGTRGRDMDKPDERAPDIPISEVAAVPAQPDPRTSRGTDSTDGLARPLPKRKKFKRRSPKHKLEQDSE